MNRRVDPKSLHPAEWSVAEAKARFSEVVARARAGQPQRVTRYGKDEVVVVSAQDWDRLNEPQTFGADWKSRPGGLLELFAPIIGSGVVFERLGGDLRPAFDDDQ
ncbi:type II toxin-antitoxin system Phd/YefM family antitoxin [uncultured Brevundimonas sp.]|uniref:type II toxin-antitoxin system Phd/YefM family antitoxin n=1 Tax=uncultured Brevundimonas sp. TaxID=213418 RepID=UPI00262E91EE|nr:type II toxin-antitoxin system Phd/YefM family antitoxin [uncultured Brevundimonas sp.]